jgi:hypothetical protein
MVNGCALYGLESEGEALRQAVRFGIRGVNAWFHSSIYCWDLEFHLSHAPKTQTFLCAPATGACLRDRSWKGCSLKKNTIVEPMSV